MPVSYECCDHVEGPFYHGTKAKLSVGDVLKIGHPSNFKEGHAANHLYFSASLETAVWGAELATALAGSSERGHIYIVEPTGPFEDDPNVTNKRFPGNPTRSYRTREAMRVVGLVEDWEGHPPEQLQGMLTSLANLKRQGLDILED
jgi:rifampin ADP-ribosylating transferase